MDEKLKVASPWITFARRVYKLFETDPEVRVEWNENDMELKLYVESQEKADALSQILPAERSFGNVKVAITIVPANVLKSNPLDIFATAFKGNPAVSFIKKVDGMGFSAGYVVFAPQVVQYYNDNLGDVHGIESTLFQEIADEVFENRDGVFFCTDIEDQTFLGRPLGEWP